jgi:DNA-binding NarL/FixJ family response regulator
VRNGIRNLFDLAEGIEIAGEAGNGQEALRLVREVHPDVVVLDIELPDIHGTRVAEQIRQDDPKVNILSLSAYDDPVFIHELLELGVAGYLMKDEAPEYILEAVRGAARGEQGWLSRRVAGRVAAWMQRGKAGGKELSVREQETLEQIVQGKTNQEIALKLGISEKTVEKYITTIFTKLNVTSRVEAAVYAVRERLI